MNSPQQPPTQKKKIRGAGSPLRIAQHIYRLNHIGSWPRKFFRSCPWDKWWHEFMTERTKTGTMFYPTAWGFARKKATSNRELEIIYKAIGPKPLELDIKDLTKATYRGIPHLGDWQQLRSKTYFYDNESIDKMRLMVIEKLNGIELGRGAATFVLEILTKWMTYDDKLDQAFEGTPLVAGLPPAQQKERVKMFFEWKKITGEMILMLLRCYLACNGICPDTINDFGAMAGVIATSAQRGALNTDSPNAALAPSAAQESPAMWLIAHAISERERLFKMKPLSVVSGEPDDDDKENPIDEDKSEQTEAEEKPDDE